mmetsp:Transcript_20517/g.35011  ORF Transcript_20517/g.35011 Transcript_20517/m.35011 type:complete len:109 (-) Transcript_20517:53-379(-)
MVRLDNDPFLNALTECYTSTEKTGTLYITYKQLIETDLPQKRKRKLDKLEGDASCLVRARTPQRKISTVVRGKDIIKFNMAITTIQKAHMTALKKRAKKKRGPRVKKE